jgi:hypothetical protein
MPNFDALVEIAPADGSEPVTVDAITSRTPGLAVTRALLLQPGYDGWWTVTHTGTGKCLPAYFPTAGQAVAFAEDVAPLADWTATEAERDPQFRAAYRSVKARHGGRSLSELEPNLTAVA